MNLHRTTSGIYVEHDGSIFSLQEETWDELLSRDDLYQLCLNAVHDRKKVPVISGTVLSPAQNQEVWAAGVTYYRSRTARIEESHDAGGSSFYDRVYSAERPELFFKSIGGKVVGHKDKLRIRRDASWSVPEPELTLLISSTGNITGYTIGNDMSSRDIEAENPLYLPQAKVYDGSCALGPSIYLTNEPLSRQLSINLTIIRTGVSAFTGSVRLTELKRDLKTLAEYLYRESSFPFGCFLMTGTGIVPPDDFTLASGDRIEITIEPIGTLINTVA